MKVTITNIILLPLMLLTANIAGQDVTTVKAKNSDISENLDLEAVASVFGEAKDLEDFEKKLNDPETQISNLDLNEDGEVDYLRVVENSKKNTHLITIQAVIGEDQFQDVATIDVEKDKSGETTVQVVGDVYMYGPEYIIQPVYVAPPVIITFFWGPMYRPWHSPYYWGYYPPYYHPWRPHPVHYYHRHVHVNVRHTYHRTHVRKSTRSVNMQKQVRRNDYGNRYPDRSFQQRNTGVKNKQDLRQQPANRSGNSNTRPANNNTKSTGRPVQKDWKPESERKGGNSNVRDNKVSVPQTRPSTPSQGKPSARPSTPSNTRPSNPQTRPAAPSTRPSAPQTRPSTPSARPATPPQTRPSSPAPRPATRPSTGPGTKPAPTRR